MRNERAWPQQYWKSCASRSNIVALCFGDHGTKEMLGVVGWKVWLVSNFARQHATTSNNMQQGVQTDATCYIQQCWELLVNNVASVCKELYSIHCFDVRLMLTIHASIASTFQSEHCQCLTFKIFNKELFRDCLHGGGKPRGNSLRWGNPPVHIICRFNLITFTW